ncbi:class I SAM-dependent methyltransferase [Maridesulfovibrio sp.]|uniref:class I SAM-dependent methyltransferase n=1 Tax=Maridesulfovibrio sp. TaxID=2795000 RepID=UPI0039F06824
MKNKINPCVLSLLQCPTTKKQFVQNGRSVVSSDGAVSYPLTDSGIISFAKSDFSSDALIQEDHYNKVAKDYVVNLGYPHTQAYLAYMDEVFKEVANLNEHVVAAEICCGAGECVSIFDEYVKCGIGIDISMQMLENAAKKYSGKNTFVHGDATNIPLQDNSVDVVMMAGGVHHINDRKKLFSEVYRILKTGGVFVAREPLNDFFLWRALRDIIYRLSPALDYDTEEPLRFDKTVSVLEECGFTVEDWKPFGFLGFILFMNSDILYFNRLFKFVPGIRKIVEYSTRFDSWVLKHKKFKNIGLQTAFRAIK